MPEAVSTRPLVSIIWLTSISLVMVSSSPKTGAHKPTILPATRALLLGGITALQSMETQKQVAVSSFSGLVSLVFPNHNSQQPSLRNNWQPYWWKKSRPRISFGSISVSKFPVAYSATSQEGQGAFISQLHSVMNVLEVSRCSCGWVRDILPFTMLIFAAMSTQTWQAYHSQSQ